MLTEEQVKAIVDAAIAASQKNSDEKLEALLKPTVESLMHEVREFTSGKLTELNTRIDGLNTGGTKDKPKQETALDLRLKNLEEELAKERQLRADQEKAAAGMRFDQELSKVLDGSNPLHKSLVQELLVTRLKTDAVEKDGKWLTKDGKTLEEASKSFFGTPEGSHFLSSTVRSGAGSKATERQPGQIDWDAEIARAFM